SQIHRIAAPAVRGSYDSMDIAVVDANGWCGYPMDLTVDGDGNPHLCYFDDTGKMLRYAVRGATGWHRYMIEDGGNVGLDCSIAVDVSGVVSIAYYDEEVGALKVARGDASGMSEITDDDDDDDDDDDTGGDDDDVSDDDDDDAADDDADDDDNDDDDDDNDNDDDGGYNPGGGCGC
ncbi:MAG TPA: hypothetical protein PK961_17590, partial [bacterium]|nr:hypothetical protein [bacterium]